MSHTETVFVTGASGFIARHIVLQLLEAGYHVRGSVRSAAKGEDVRRTMEKETGGAVGDDRLSFFELDLNRDQGWDAALDGADALLHTASPFPISQPKDENDLIRPAVDGTLRALRAARATGVHRVVLTSSVVAVTMQDPMPESGLLTEENWSDTDSPACHAYGKSKTLAERAAWDFVATNPDLRLTTINPALVVGPALDADFGSSLSVIKRALSGKDPALPKLMMDIVDVRDIARMHVAALASPASEGERLIGSAGQLWFEEVADVLRQAFPDRRIPSRIAPNWAMRFLGLFDPEIKSIVPLLGKRFGCSGAKAQEVLGIDFIPPRDAVRASAQFLVDNGHA